ncbi:MAG: hypothetical protein AAF219_07180 [Myxococcota bacterium]
MKYEAADSVFDELSNRPERFKATGGYDRLIGLLTQGSRSDIHTAKQLLQKRTEYTGDLLWALCELDDLEPYVSEALLHTDDSDPGTAAYAVEVVLRGAVDPDQFRLALDHSVSSDDDAVVEHAARVLAGFRFHEIIEQFTAIGWSWAARAAEELNREPSRLEPVRDLVTNSEPDRHFFGVVLATLASRSNARAALLLRESSRAWARDHGQWLEELYRSSEEDDAS